MHLAAGSCGCCVHEDVCFGYAISDGRVFFVCPACCAAGLEPPDSDGEIPLALDWMVWDFANGPWRLATDSEVRASALAQFLGERPADGYPDVWRGVSGFVE